ncbi:MAG TPA: AAA family ATPase [Micromonosporaceae bacterium]|nr:AAA family ATPase [Micromonosporaceae bacterium]
MNGRELSGCVIVSGMPAAGKSTVTGLAARLLPRAARIKADDLNEMILSGRVGYLGQPAEEALRQAELCNRNLCSMAGNFVDFGFTVLVDQLVENRSELNFLVDLLAPRPVGLVTLAPGPDVCRQRNSTREPDEQFDFTDYDALHDDMRREFDGVGWWFDTSALTPEETAARLVREAPYRAIR